MKRDHHDFPALQPADLHWRENNTPVSAAFGDVYYSTDDGLQESQHTFVRGNGLPERWQHFADPVFCIAETGFGTALNFLLTWQAWLQAAEPKPDLHYLAVEAHPLHTADLARALANWETLAQLRQTLLDQYPALIPGCHRLLFNAGRVRLDLHLGDVHDVMGELASCNRHWIDAWYLDGFAPATNPAMWTDTLAQHTARLSNPGATLATFTAAGAVRRAWAAAGFSMHKAAGFGRKREALRGVWQRDATPPASTAVVRPPAPEQVCTAPTGDAHATTRPGAGAPTAAEGQPSGQTLPLPSRGAAAAQPAVPRELTPWDIGATPLARPSHAVVLGAGLAGCWVAHCLAQRGIPVTVLEQAHTACAGSGNAQGVLYTRLSHRHSLLTDFSLLSYAFATRRYRALFASDALREGRDGALCGNLQLVDNPRELSSLRRALAAVPGLADILDARAASEKAAITLHSAAYWFPDSGWLDPRAVCAALLRRANITLREHCGALRLQHDNGRWDILDAAGQPVARADCVVVAAGTETSDIAQLAWLPIRGIRGQTTQLPTLPALHNLRTALCHAGYIAPARAGEHCIGASFELDAPADAPSEREHTDNLHKLATALPQLADALGKLQTAALAGRAALRCASPDYLPMVGPVPDYAAFLQRYAALRDNARQTLDHTAPQLPGLYVTTAHGSRGLTSTPLAAELLASTICNEPPPLERSLCRALSPARFIIRDLARHKIQEARPCRHQPAPHRPPSPH